MRHSPPRCARPLLCGRSGSPRLGCRIRGALARLSWRSSYRWLGLVSPTLCRGGAAARRRGRGTAVAVACPRKGAPPPSPLCRRAAYPVPLSSLSWSFVTALRATSDVVTFRSVRRLFAPHRLNLSPFAFLASLRNARKLVCITVFTFVYSTRTTTLQS